MFVCLFVCLFVHTAGSDFLPTPSTAVQTFRERNVNWPLCKEITIVDDENTEELEQFSAQLVLNEEDTMGVQVKFDPNTATVKIEDDDGNYITSVQMKHSWL